MSAIKEKNIMSIILDQTDNFTQRDIFKEIIGNPYFEEKKEDKIKNAIDENIEMLCEMNLIKNTLLYYYVR